ncbi:hypothetical protein HID58_032932 [Brassica napus]|uniref:PheRS DNA binding domain-containing protein n=3 Tax=Brassica TaxID=3705 RepID=A0ABQ8BXT5_BRANA|nr:hypothetical protein HID58_032932 [Brassica napus]
MDAAIEVDLKLRDKRRWMNVYTKSNHNPQLSNKAMNLGAQTGDIGFDYYAAEPEIHFFSAIPEEGSISKDDLEKKLDPSVFKIGSTQAAKKRWVAMGKQVSRKVQHVEDKVKESLLQIQQGLELDKESLNSLKTRKLLVTYWKELEFKEYNFNAKGQPLDASYLHPLLKVDGDDDEADKGGTITVEKKVRFSGIRRRDERQQEEDMDAAIEVDLKLRDKRRWMNVYTKSNHNPQLSNKAMNLGAQTGDIGFDYYAAEPEIHFFSAIPEEGSISKDDLEKKLDPSVFKIGSTQAAKKRWVAMGKQVSRKVQHVEDKVKESLLQIQQGLVCLIRTIMGWTGYSDVEKGPNYAPKRKIFATDLTRENLHNWKELEFKEYNFNAKGQPLDASYLHPLLKVSDSLSFCPSDQQSFMSELDSQVSTAFDPFADAMLRTQVREQRSTSTSVCSSAMVGKA